MATEAPGPELCSICMERPPELPFSCSHGICKTCVRSWVDPKFAKGPAPKTIECFVCRQTLLQWELPKLLTPLQLGEMANHLLDQYEAQEKKLVWCPFSCGQPLVIPDPPGFHLTCDRCLHEFCLRCKNEQPRCHVCPRGKTGLELTVTTIPSQAKETKLPVIFSREPGQLPHRDILEELMREFRITQESYAQRAQERQQRFTERKAQREAERKAREQEWVKEHPLHYPRQDKPGRYLLLTSEQDAYIQTLPPALKGYGLQLFELTCDQLKERCRIKGCKLGGRKLDLVARLMDRPLPAQPAGAPV